MLYGLSRILCQNSAKTVRKNPAVQCLENRANTLEKCAQNLWTVRPSISVQVRMDCTDFLSQKNVPTLSSKSVPINVVWQPWNACQYTQKNSVVVLLDFCAHLLLYGLLKSVLYGLLSLLSAALKPVPASCLETRALALHMLPLSQARPLSCSLALQK
jgi:hypothetical protein